MECWDVPTVVVPASHRARRVKVEASCCANLDAPARDAGWIRQRRPLRASGETECRYVQAQVAARVPRRGVERPAGRSPAPVHRPVRSQRHPSASRPARHGRHGLRPALRRRQPPGAAGRRRRMTFAERRHCLCPAFRRVAVSAANPTMPHRRGHRAGGSERSERRWCARDDVASEPPGWWGSLRSPPPYVLEPPNA